MKNVFFTIILALVGGALYAQSAQPRQTTAEASAVSSVEYWVDDAIDSRTVQPMSGSTVSFAVDTKSLREGFHTLYYRLKDDAGVHSAVRTWHFFVCEKHTFATTRIVAIEYWIDVDIDHRMQQSISENQTEIALTLPFLEDGMHTLYYRLLDSDGNYSAVYSHLFEANNVTPVPVIFSEEKQSSKIVDHHHVFILTSDGRIYDASGMQVK